MKKLLIIMLTAATLFSCKTNHNCADITHKTCDGRCTCDGMECGHVKVLEQCKHNIPNSIVIIPADTTGERHTFTVIFEDEKAMDYMYPEEIAESLKTGVWQYNEDLRVK